MAQQRRMIYASVYANAELNMKPIEERHLYIGTLVLADDDGKLRADPRYLKGAVFPFDDKITVLDVKKWLDDLGSTEQILLYERDGVKVLKHPNWKKYQHIRGDSYTPSKLPNPLRSSNDCVTDLVHKEVSNKESNKERNMGDSALFEEFWKEYPPTRKQDKQKCLSKFFAFEAEGIGAAIVEDVKRRKVEHEDWVKQNGAFVPAPLVYLNNRRWEAPIFKGKPKAGVTAKSDKYENL